MTGGGGVPILAARGVVQRFGGIEALRGVHLEVYQGDIVGLIGPNGAGKTTLFNVMSGFLSPTAGEVYFEGRPVHGWPPYRLARMGLARTFQITRPFRTLTALDNVVVALGHERFGRPWEMVRRYGDAATLRAAENLLERVGLAPYALRPAGSLPLGLQRRLEVARALALAPKVLLLDEPAAGLNPQEVEEMVALIRRLHAEGLTLLIVEHNMSVAMGLCRRIAVLHNGVKIAEGPPEVVASDPMVIEAYLGRAPAQAEGDAP